MLFKMIRKVFLQSSALVLSTIYWVRNKIKNTNKAANTTDTKQTPHPTKSEDYHKTTTYCWTTRKISQAWLNNSKPSSNDRVTSTLRCKYWLHAAFSDLDAPPRCFYLTIRTNLQCHSILTLFLPHQQSRCTLSSHGAWRRPAWPLPAEVVWVGCCCIL